jgi:hypothetical protein
MAKIKIKTNRGAAKRFRKTASGKYKAGHAELGGGGGHRPRLCVLSRF